jgi:phosphoribosylaminoimidazole-succinocarboxamide synthase
MLLRKALESTVLAGLAPARRGKVRDVYDLGDSLLIVSTDRVSAFDVVLSPGIPDKGKILNQLSNFWFGEFPDVENHLIETDAGRFPPALGAHRELLAGRAVVVKKCAVVPFECVARGYLAGSGYKDYVRWGSVCGIPLPPGLREADRLSEPIFTPATKAETGHDVNISEEEAGRIVGRELVARLKTLTLEIYRRGCDHAESKGIIIADTKFEFGLARRSAAGAEAARSSAHSIDDLHIILIDEVLTPDSSRFWPAAQYAPGHGQPSFDKQFVRDYLEQIRWNKQPPVPSLPDDVIARTRGKYVDAFRLLSGRELV